MKTREIDELVSCQVRGYERQEYLKLVGRITIESFREDLELRLSNLGDNLGRLGLYLGLEEAGFAHLQSISKYVIEGDCSYFSSAIFDDFGNKDGFETILAEESFNLLGFQELLDAFDEFNGMHNRSPSLYLVMNMLRPRVYIDIARLGGQLEWDISLIELSLLAGLKERTLRTYAVKGHSHYLAANKSMVSPLVAHKWLLGRKFYAPTKLPESRKAQTALLGKLKTYDI